jgi:hypothetical protein
MDEAQNNVLSAPVAGDEPWESDLDKALMAEFGSIFRRIFGEPSRI